MTTINEDKLYNQVLNSKICPLCKGSFEQKKDPFYLHVKNNCKNSNCYLQMISSCNNYFIINYKKYRLAADSLDQEQRISIHLNSNKGIDTLLSLNFQEWLETFKDFNYDTLLKVFFKYVDNGMFL